MDEIPLIVPTMIKFELFMRMIASVDYPIKPYIIDNSRDNHGVAKSWNKGIKSAMSDGYKYAIISNDDIEFTKGTIESLINSIKFIDAVTISPNGQLIGRDSNYHYPRNGYINASQYSCFIVNMEKMVESAGYFDENFYPGYYEDNDMNYRIKLSGGNEFLDTEVGIIHYGSATGSEVVSHDRWLELEQYYISKWGGKPRQEIWTSPYNDPSKDIKYWHGIDE
jgi:GT2 family glycosyltransferase